MDEPDRSRSDHTETAILAGGCFWCTEAVFEPLRGVEAVESGYTGGRVENPTYEDVCAGRTGHAEAVRITYDPDEIRYRELLEVFFATHDPTTPNRQGADVGTQYRSAIFYLNDDQKREAESVIRELEAEGVFPSGIVTEVEPADVFYAAEEYHRDYYRRNPEAGYCRVVIEPKLRKLRKTFEEKLER